MVLTRVRNFGLIFSVAAVALTACSGGTTAPAGKVDVAFCAGVDCSVTSLNDDGSTVNVSVVATNASGGPGTGTVHISALVGTINGKAADDVTLDATGAATASYACDVATIPGCATSATLVTATWNGITGSARLLLGAQSAGGGSGGGSGGGTDGGAGGTGGGTGGGSGGGTSTPTTDTVAVFTVNPTSIGTSAAAANGLPTTATIFFQVLGNNTPVSGVTVTFAPGIGENLLTFSTMSAVSDSNGFVSLTVTSKGDTGTAHVVASLALSNVVATATVGIFGPPASIVETAVSLDLLGIQGSGIQEEGQMTFTVRDAFGTPVPGAQVTFATASSGIITLTNTTGGTAADGTVVVAYTSGTEPGVTTIIATAAAGVTGSHQVAVRGAKPSAYGFSFTCDDLSLRVNDTVTGYATTTCHVKLTDRNSNRVGIPTPVNFASEAGAITASAVTQAYDPSNPTAEGTVDVVFSTNFANGSGPADVIPLEPEPAGTYPSQRTEAEPRRTPANSQITYNPRDQLVTIIAWTQGEEEFTDANHNGKYDPGELFVDQGDPFIDENDDNLYDQVVPNGQFEPRFCGATTNGTCPAYNGPNGQWDSQTTIWVPTWIVFTGAPAPTSIPAGAAAPTNQFAPGGCADYSDAAGHTAQITADVYAYDEWFNRAVGGSTYKQTDFISPLASTSAADITLLGFNPEQQNYGALAGLGIQSGFSYGPVSSAPGGGPCTTTNGAACVNQIHFDHFDDGKVGTIFFDNPLVGFGHFGCAPGINNGAAPTPFTVQIAVTTPDGTSTDYGDFSGTFASAALTDGGT